MSTFVCTCHIKYKYVLVLNPMMSNVESCQEFGPFDTAEQARSFYDQHLAPEPYTEEGPNMFGDGVKKYSKMFRKDSPLEWNNPLYGNEWETPNHWGHGLHEVITSVTNVERGGQIY
jgi:hypothetical protein